MIRCNYCFEKYDEKVNMCPHCGYVADDEPEEANHLYPGTVLRGRYQIGMSVGGGGFGIIYKAWDIKFETVVAVKEYYPNTLVNRIPGEKEVILSSLKKRGEFEYGRAHFIEEARCMARFSSRQDIVEVFEFFEENNTAYIVMEFLEETLAGYLKRTGGKIDVEDGLKLGVAVCEALKALHKEGIIHRDISPDNIFICKDGIKLIDFGAARLAVNENQKLSVILKPGYAPPEQYERINKQGPWTDIYALGATLYTITTGVKPEESTNRMIKDNVVPPSQLNPEISESVSNAIMKAIAIERHLRFQNVTEFSRALSGQIKVRTLSDERKKRKVRRIISIVTTLLIVSAAGFFLYQDYEDRKYGEGKDLRAADITIWISIEDGSDEMKAFETIKSDFTKSYKEISIELVGIPASRYEQEIKEAIEGNSLPTIFESSGLSENLLSECTSIKAVLDSEQGKECYLLDKYSQYYADDKKLPLAMNAPIAALITSGNVSVDYKEPTFTSLEDIVLKGRYSVNDDAASMWESMLGSDVVSNRISEAKFYGSEGENKTAILLTSTDYFNDTKQKLVLYGKAFSFYTGSKAGVKFSYEWSIGGGTETEIAAAERLMSWMLGASYQNILMIAECQDGQIPLNKECFEEKCVNELSPLKDIIDEMKILK